MAIATVNYNDFSFGYSVFNTFVTQYISNTYNISSTSQRIGNVVEYGKACTQLMTSLAGNYDTLYHETVLLYDTDKYFRGGEAELGRNNIGSFLCASMVKYNIMSKLAALFNQIDAANRTEYNTITEDTKSYSKVTSGSVTKDTDSTIKDAFEQTPLGDASTDITYPTSKGQTVNDLSDTTTYNNLTDTVYETSHKPLNDFIVMLQNKLPTIESIFLDFYKSINKEACEVC